MAKPTAHEIVMQDRQEFTQKIIENLEKGYLLFEDHFDRNLLSPINATTDLQYKGYNRLKLATETYKNGYKDNRWVTFNQAQKKGWKVKKGEHGVRIEYWKFTEKDIVKSKDFTNEKGDTETLISNTIPKDTLVKANYSYVYNAEQIEGIPEKEPVKYNYEYEDVIDTLVSSSECSIMNVGISGKAFYSPAKDEIVLPPFEAFKSSLAYISTLTHEMSHSTGHHSRLNRELEAFETDEKAYAKEEIIAQISAMFLQSDLKLDFSDERFDNETAYVKDWATAIKNDNKILFEAIREAEKSANYLYANYEKEIEKEVEANITIVEKVTEEDMKFQNIYDSIGDSGEPKVLINWAEENLIQSGTVFTLSEADKLYAELDDNYNRAGYCKTSFTIISKYDGEMSKYTGRLDIGDKDGGLIEHIKNTWEAELKYGDGRLDEYSNIILNEFVPYLEEHQLATKLLGTYSSLESKEPTFYSNAIAEVDKLRSDINNDRPYNLDKLIETNIEYKTVEQLPITEVKSKKSFEQAISEAKSQREDKTTKSTNIVNNKIRSDDNEL